MPALDAAEIARAVEVLASGGLVALPTETVYGLGADAGNPVAVRRIFAAKRRPVDHPLIVHIASATQLDHWCAEVPEAAKVLAAAFWPGPLTLILKRAAHVPDEVTGGQDTIGVRVPAHPLALELLRAFRGGVAAPSANRFGHVSPTTAEHVRAELGAEVDMVLDGGPCTVGIESTIVDLTTAQPRILRPGGISRAQVEHALGAALMNRGAVAASPAPRVSGALASHYAPETPVRWVERSSGDAAALLVAAAGVAALGVISTATNDVFVAQHGVQAVWRALPAVPEDYARALYACLRELDERNLDLILLDVPPDTPEWEAVRDRLRRAAGLGQDGAKAT